MSKMSKAGVIGWVLQLAGIEENAKGDVRYAETG